ncbi:AIPR family protein [Falsiroseomonas oryziterrae]|uniref:AIPR family protein n=1 Tax=Falsiroseomonas oryziterrae TaxID=2911368 RepID=UPI001F1BE4B3|nr:AIPR family protein [Roseomonas sp. NPKOSM-4]
MQPPELDYAHLTVTLKPYVAKGLPESAAFLNWFLEHIYRLDDVDARDAICDSSNDKGIDGVYVDEYAEEIILFQTKIRQNSAATLGDTALKEFLGSITQFETAEKVDAILQSAANAELKKIIVGKNLSALVRKGYAVKGNFICNHDPDHNAREFLQNEKRIDLFDRRRICDEYIDLSLPDGVKQSFSFSCGDAPLIHQVSDLAILYMFPAAATELVALPGISDGNLFAQNVRLSLGNTEVNKAIAKTLQDKSQHRKFPLFHNGVTLLCDKASLSDGKVSVENFVVVNGAQSLTALHQSKSQITSDLRILLRIIQVSGNQELARQITLISNNQNAIKPRDLRSNHQLQIRLKSEFDTLKYDNYVLEIKRGEQNPGKRVLSNEEAGRLLLAFDLAEPWSCHQLYKLFDDLYTRIFGRPEATARRIILMDQIMGIIQHEMNNIENKPFASYTLTRFFILDVVAQILRRDKVASEFLADPSPLLADTTAMDRFKGAISNILSGIIQDLNYEVRSAGEMFDYKSMLKSQKESRDLASKLIATFSRDVARKKAETFSQLWSQDDHS